MSLQGDASLACILLGRALFVKLWLALDKSDLRATGERCFKLKRPGCHPQALGVSATLHVFLLTSLQQAESQNWGVYEGGRVTHRQGTGTNMIWSLNWLQWHMAVISELGRWGQGKQDDSVMQ